MLDGNGKWVPEDNIRRSDRSAQNFWETPAGGYGSGWGGGLAAALSGLGYGVFSSDANAASRSNQDMRAGVMRRAADAKDNLSLSKVLMQGGIPGMDEKGMGIAADARNIAESRAFQEKQAAASRAHAERLLALQGAQQLANAKAMLPHELEKAERLKRLEQQLSLEQQQKQIEMLFPKQAAATGDLGPASTIAQAMPPQSAATTTPMGGIDPARAERARRALLLGDKAAAVKILTGDEERKGNEAYDTEAGKKLAEADTKLRDDALTARDAINTTQALRQLVNSGALTQGPGSQLTYSLHKMGSFLGIPSEKLNNAQLFEAIVNKLGLGNAQNMKGALSDKDILFIKSMGPSIDNTKEANVRMLDYIDRLNRRQIEVATLADRYKARNGGRLDAGFYPLLQQWADQNPLFSDQDRVTPQQGPAVAGGLPKGWGVNVIPPAAP